jgi:hypothetical protein
VTAYKKRIAGMECLEAEVEALRAKCASLEEARARGDAAGGPGGGGVEWEAEVEAQRAKCASLEEARGAAAGRAGEGGGEREAELEEQLRSAKRAVEEMEEEATLAMNERSALQARSLLRLC